MAEGWNNPRIRLLAQIEKHAIELRDGHVWIGGGAVGTIADWRAIQALVVTDEARLDSQEK